MGILPQQLPLEAMQNRWATQLNPLLLNPLTQGQLLEQILLKVGSNSINHRLGRKLRGWIVVAKDGAAEIYDAQATNQTPQLTLLLTSDANVLISLWVF